MNRKAWDPDLAFKGDRLIGKAALKSSIASSQSEGLHSPVPNM